MARLFNDEQTHRYQRQVGQRPAATTLHSLGRKQIEGLCGALGIMEQAARTQATFDMVSSTWGDRALDRPRFTSDITDDSSPYEFSVAFDGRSPELRLLAEAQGHRGTAREQWTAGWRLSEQLAHSFGASLDRVRRVAHLFEPESLGLTFALWHAASFRAQRPSFRIYFNPQARGQEQAMPSVLTALETLGMSGAAAWLRDRFSNGEHNPLYFSVDLSDCATARCKVYLAHPGATAEQIEQLTVGFGGHKPGELRAFCRTMTGSEGPWTSRPPLTCLAFREGSDVPYTITFHMPIRCYAPNEQVALDRISSLLTPIEALGLKRAVRSLARRPLDKTTGIQTYASVRHEEGRRRMTIYLSPEAYSAQPR
ncbi:MAG TPA: tryptophan dimethylallyltransferase family protein [Kofleriaceae bacterium]|jgi:DMATS type aromatic prenyltransferase|nr:tryptophan dimethylallyltransferase family protein [Kofleriaceae bacterium]